MILDEFPSVEEFYKTYWGKKPFVVRNFIDVKVFDNLIDGDTLAGLALEEEIKSRMVISPEIGDNWVCHHGPLDEDIFAKVGEKNWSLLVQNVDQYHESTADLLKHFHFSPRWLMDDIMVSYSAVGGGVGAHMDSYHVFLLQGKGKRKWKISHEIIENIECSEYVEGIDLKVFKNSFDGEEVEVSMGDVLYIPPHFGHEGETIEEAMTFSVGFLGLKWSEILIEYGAYLEQKSKDEDRYYGQGIDANSGGFLMDAKAQNSMQNHLTDMIKSEDFSIWLAGYLSMPTSGEPEIEEDNITNEELLELLQAGMVLYRPESVKISITTLSGGGFNLAIYGDGFSVSKEYESLIARLNKNLNISIEDVEKYEDINVTMDILVYLFNKNILIIQKK